MTLKYSRIPATTSLTAYSLRKQKITSTVSIVRRPGFFPFNLRAWTKTACFSFSETIKESVWISCQKGSGCLLTCYPSFLLTFCSSHSPPRPYRHSSWQEDEITLSRKRRREKKNIFSSSETCKLMIMLNWFHIARLQILDLMCIALKSPRQFITIINTLLIYGEKLNRVQ